MVKRIFDLFYKEIKGLHEAAYLLAFFAFLSQLLALLRDRVLASTFGASNTLDIYYSSFRIPDFIFVTVASIVSISVLVPFITDKLDKSEEEGKKFINSVFSSFSIIIFITSIIFYFLIPYLVPFIFQGMSDTTEIVKMSRILLFSPILLGFSNFFASITQVGKRFLIYALSPLFYNIGIILGVLFFYPVFGIYGLAYGVILGALMHLFIQVPFVVESKLFRMFPINFDFSSVKKVILISIPRTITLGMTQISIIVLLGIASLMKEGTISIFNFAYNLQSVPLSIIGVSYSVAAFPTLSKFFSGGKRDEFLSHIVSGARYILFWSIPITILFVVLRAQIVRTVYGAGEFSWANTKLTAAALAIFAFSVVAQSLVLLFIRGFYAMGNTKKSLYASLLTGLLSIGFSFLFIRLFEHFYIFKYFIENLFRIDDTAGSEVLMIALGFTLAQIVNCAVLWISFEKEFKGFSVPLLNTFFQSFSASVIMGFVAYMGLNIFDNIYNINTLIGIFLQGFSAGVLGIISALVVLKLLGSVELDEIWKAFHKKFWKAKTTIPDTNQL
ncbi:MAG: lipid II flippase MurJ [Candidatus Paceibacterota bacterium]|jgi:putative peptidoglycan lipid II flippase